MRATLLVMGLVVAGCFGRSTANVSTGRWVEELKASTAQLYGFGGDATLGVFVGSQGLYRRDEGGQWRVVPGSDDHVWYELEMVGSELWAVGQYGAVLRQSAGGGLQAQVEGVATALYNITATGDTVWVSAHDDRLWRWNGTTWSVSQAPELASYTLGAMFALGPDRMLAHVPPKATGKPLHMGVLEGDRWTFTSIGKRWGYVASMRGTGADAVWAVGMRHAGLFGKDGFAMRWDGKGWVDEPLPVKVPLNDVSVRGPNEAWAVGWEGTLLRWDGKTWTVKATGGKAALTAVYAAPDGAVYAVEQHTRLLRWQEGSP